MACGFDCGTYNLVCCTRDEEKAKEGKEAFIYDKEVNAFIEIPLEDDLVYNMMDTAEVPLIKRAKKAYALGEKAVRFAYTIPGLELKRPMKDGCVNPQEKEAYELLNNMVQNLLDGNVKAHNEVLYYSVPANAVNIETDADFHASMLKSIFNGYESDQGFKVSAHPINEGLALVYAELKANNYSGLGISFGAGMVNLCFAMFGMPVFSFAIVNSGDWIDKMAAKATGESVTYINQQKMNVKLNQNPTTLVERAIQTQYRIMIEKTIKEIKKGLAECGKKARVDKPIDVVIAGGTSLPEGFDLLFRDILTQAELDLPIGNIVRPADPLFSVSRGCLIAAENSVR